MLRTHLTTANDQHVLVLDLPCEDQAAAALDLWKLALRLWHDGILHTSCEYIVCVCREIAEKAQKRARILVVQAMIPAMLNSKSPRRNQAMTATQKKK